MGFDAQKIHNPLFFKENCLPAHSDHVACADEAERGQNGENGAYGRSAFRLSLDGVWKFHYAKNYAQTVPGFEAAWYDCKPWDDIRVPAHIQMEGYDIPHYTNSAYPWDGREDVWTADGAPTEFNPVASYVKYFTIPDGFMKNGLFVSFQGVESGFALWCNGHYVGYSEDSFTPSEFELTPFVVDGENKLAVQAFKWTASSWCEDQDFFRFSGIFRSVYLYTMPSVHAFDVKIMPVVDEDLRGANLAVDLKVHFAAQKSAADCTAGEAQNTAPQSAENCAGGECGKAQCAAPQSAINCTVGQYGSVRFTLSDGGEVLFSETGSFSEMSAQAVAQNRDSSELSPQNKDSSGLSAKNADSATPAPYAPFSATEFHFEKRVDAPKLWSAETPHLYLLKLELFDADGARAEVIFQNVGFRRFELRDGLMLLNGKRIVFKGVNRHEFSARTGRVVSREELLRDIVTMKRNNINAIRTCHYPDASGIYDLCDEYGLYLVAENNLESHGTWDAALRGKAPKDAIVPGDNPDWKPMMLDRVTSCAERDKNHPSILIWSCGNEAYGGKVIFDMAEKFRELDKSRLVHYEGVFHDRRYNATSDMESQMYTPAAEIKKFLAEHKEKPFICCEYMHAMGNSCGAMHKYTDLTDAEPRYQGGFIWDYIDQSIVRRDRYGNEFYAYGGDFGDRPTDGNFSGNGICYGDRTPSPKMQEVKFNYQNISVRFDDGIQFLVVNKNLFVNTSQYACVVTLQKDGVPIKSGEVETAVAPLSEKAYKFPFSVPQDGDVEYAVTVSFRLRTAEKWADAGHEVAFGQKVYKNTTEMSKHLQAIRVTRGKDNIGVRGENFECLFSLTQGGLVSYRYAGRELLERKPVPNFWRAPVDNDKGSLAPARYAQWKIASLYASHRSGGMFEEVPVRFSETENSATVAYTYYLPTAPAAKCGISYTAFGDGTIETQLSYDPVVGLPDMPEFGMMFSFDADYDTIEWYGLGPEETYADRCLGAKLGVYKNRVADNMAKYLVPQECGNKMGVRWAKVVDARGRGILFSGDEINFSALPYTPHELENAMHSYDLPKIRRTVVRVALAQMGVGGDDSWGAPVHPEYHIDVTKPLEFAFRFRGI